MSAEPADGLLKGSGTAVEAETSASSVCHAHLLGCKDIADASLVQQLSISAERAAADGLAAQEPPCCSAVGWRASQGVKDGSDAVPGCKGYVCVLLQALQRLLKHLYGSVASTLEVVALMQCCAIPLSNPCTGHQLYGIHRLKRHYNNEAAKCPPYCDLSWRWR